MDESTGEVLWAVSRQGDGDALVSSSTATTLGCTVTRRACCNVHRGTGRYRELLQRLRTRHARPTWTADLLSGPLGSDEDLSAALRALRPGDLRLLTIVVLEDFPLADAAQVLGITPGATKTRPQRARVRLRAALSDHSGARNLTATPEGHHDTGRAPCVSDQPLDPVVRDGLRAELVRTVVTTRPRRRPCSRRRTLTIGGVLLVGFGGGAPRWRRACCPHPGRSR